MKNFLAFIGALGLIGAIGLLIYGAGRDSVSPPVEAAQPEATATYVAAAVSTMEALEASKNTPDPTATYEAAAVATMEALEDNDISGMAVTVTPAPTKEATETASNGMTAEKMEADCEGPIGGDLRKHNGNAIGCIVPGSVELFDGACVDFDPRSTEVRGEVDVIDSGDGWERVKLVGEGEYVGEYEATVYWSPCTKR